MAEEQNPQTYPCPSCGKTVSIQDLKCEFCGVDLKSGESFQTQVGRKKSKARHSEHFADTVLIGVIMVFALIITGGFLYQRRVSNVISGQGGEDSSPGIRPTILALDLIDQLILIAESDYTAQQKLEYAQERVNSSAYDPVFYETFDLRSALRSAKVRDGNWGDGAGDPATYARTLAEALRSDLKELDREIQKVEEGSYTDNAAGKRFARMYGEDFAFGAYRRLIKSLQARLEMRMDRLEAIKGQASS